MSTTVLLRVTPKEPIDLDIYLGEVPADVAAALRAAGQSVPAGLSGRRGPWRLQFQLSGQDRVEDAQQLQSQLRSLGYEAEVHSSP